MTERFTLDEYYHIEDNYEQKIYDGGEDTDSILDLLNELSEVTVKLEEELQYYKSKCSSLEEGLFKAHREISMLKNTIGRNENYIRRLTNIGKWHK